MYRFITVLFTVLLTAGITHAQKTAQICAVAFYNFENLFDTLDDPKNWGDDEFLPNGPYAYTGKVYQQKLDNLTAVISRMATDITPDGPAIIGTAEIENSRVLQELVQQPAIKECYKFIHFDSYDSRGVDVAMLYNPAYFKVLYARALYVDISKVGDMKGGKTRDVLYVRGLLAGDTVDVFVNHWPSRRGGEAASAPLRAVAARVAKNVMDSLTVQNPQARIILMGDLNDDPVSESITLVLGAKGDKEKVGSSGLYNPWVRYYKQGYGTLGYDDRWNLFDQIIISGSFLKRNHPGGSSHWEFYKSEVFKKDFMTEKFGQYKGYPKRSFSNNQWNNGYSDHFPTILYFTKMSN
ncbi:MAG TPA: hypothetical protein VL098_13050 [Flavipsychrobacter sp.]|nr:hypothetical protein [Flavipsychrobacter sp.]